MLNVHNRIARTSRISSALHTSLDMSTFENDQKILQEKTNRELFLELGEPPIHPEWINVQVPLKNGLNKNFFIEVNGELLWLWKARCGSRPVLFHALQANLAQIGFVLHPDASDRIGAAIRSHIQLISHRMKGIKSGKRRKAARGEKWVKIEVARDEMIRSPGDLLAEFDKENELLKEENERLRKENDVKSAKIYSLMKERLDDERRHHGKPFNEVGERQQKRILKKFG